MPGTLQEFLATSAVTSANELKTAFLALPEDKRNWSPEADARTAIDMMAEVALNNEVTARMLEGKVWPSDFDPEQHNRAQAELGGDWATLETVLETNTARVAELIRAVPDSDLAVEITMPWGKEPFSEYMAYPYWNTKYHTGQINYIASLLGIK